MHETVELASREVDSARPGGLQVLRRWARGYAGSRVLGNEEGASQGSATRASEVPDLREVGRN